MKKDEWAHKCKNSHPLILDQFGNRWTFEGSICKIVACPACVTDKIICGWIRKMNPTIADTRPISVRHAKSIWKWYLSFVTYSCATRLSGASSAVCRVVSQAWKSAGAACWRVAGCAIPWLSSICGTSVLSCYTALGIYLGLARYICKCFRTSWRWKETADAYFPRQKRDWIWIFKRCTAVTWSTWASWICITLETCCASSWRITRSTVSSYAGISSASCDCG